MGCGCSLFGYSIFFLFVMLLLLPVLRSYLRKRVDFAGKHCVVTGGSKGIGLSLAKELAAQGAKVTVVARSTVNESGIHSERADVANYQQVVDAVARAEEKNGPTFLMVACAGLALPKYFLDQDISDFRYQMDVNYMGSVHAAKAVAPGMTQRREGYMLFVSSGVCAGGFLGYASYAPTKYAVRALADSLRNELLGFGVRVSICFPPDTDTPGFEHENLTKPKETLQITPPSVFPALTVAKGILDGLKKGYYNIPGPDIIQNLALASNIGTAERYNPVLECLIAGPIIGLIQQAWRVYADNIAKGYGKSKREAGSSKKSN